MPIMTWVFAVFGLFMALAAIPLMLRRVPPNPIYGLRVPATFRDERVWYDANAASGRDMLFLGIVAIVAGFVVPRVATNPWTLQIVWIGIAAGGGVAVAFLGWRRANRMLRERTQTP